jgi:hypothetical protein
LTQAFQQLDQQQLYGVACRVCRAWQQLTLRSFHTINLTLSSAATAQQFSSWMRKYGTYLHHLTLDNVVIYFGPLASFQQLSAELPSARNLLSLKMLYWPASADLAPLSTLANLTSLQISHIYPPSPTMWPPLYLLSKLQALNLSHTGLAHCDVPCLVSSLQQLTSLDLSHGGVSITAEALNALRGLPKLQELQLMGCNINSKLQQAVQLPCTEVTLSFEDNAEQLQDLLCQPWAEKLVQLEISYGTFWPGEEEARLLLMPLTSLSRLRSLTVGFPCCASSVSMLAGLTSLTRLQLQVVNILVYGIGAALNQLSGLPGLRELNVSALEEVQDSTAERALRDDLKRSLPQLAFRRLAVRSS